jgi:hypothetical protein
MNWFARCWDFLRRWNTPLDEWFTVVFDSKSITLNARPAGRPPWTQMFKWNEIAKILFVGEGGLVSDGIYFFTTQRPKSFVVPTDASGGNELMQELIARKYFDSPRFTEVLLSPNGAYWWPEELNEKPAP